MGPSAAHASPERSPERRLHRQPTRPSWSDREVAVLRLLAAGMSTREVARTLCWSERTIKNVVADLTARHGLRNRTHAVAVAVRAGVV